MSSFVKWNNHGGCWKAKFVTSLPCWLYRNLDELEQEHELITDNDPYNNVVTFEEHDWLMSETSRAPQLSMEQSTDHELSRKMNEHFDERNNGSKLFKLEFKKWSCCYRKHTSKQ